MNYTGKVSSDKERLPKQQSMVWPLYQPFFVYILTISPFFLFFLFFEFILNLLLSFHLSSSILARHTKFWCSTKYFYFIYDSILEKSIFYLDLAKVPDDWTVVVVVCPIQLTPEKKDVLVSETQKWQIRLNKILHWNNWYE